MGDNTPEQPEEVVVSEDVKSDVTEEAPKGSLTPENRQYAAFLEERDRRRDAEKRIQRLERKLEKLAEPPEVFPVLPTEAQHSEEGLRLKKEIDRLEDEILNIKGSTELNVITAKFPEIRNNLDEFQDFRSEYPGVPTEKVAKLFLVEKGMAPVFQERTGLEAPTGGSREPAKPGVTVDDLKRLRETDSRRYHKMLKNGEISIGDLRQM